MEEVWRAKRSELRQLLQDHPEWTNNLYAETLGMSVSWVKDWKRVFKRRSDDEIIFGRGRYRRTPCDGFDQQAIDAILDIRDNPPDYCQRKPGPMVIQYELTQRFADTKARYPRSTSTIWAILDQHQRIIRAPQRDYCPMKRPDPMKHWEIDFTDVTTVPSDPEGKKQHTVEMFNVVDRGSSILVESTASGEYTAETSIEAMVDVFLEVGLPDVITFDRDPRFIGGYQGDSFPSAFMRFLLCLEIELDICPPRRPDLKPFVERIHRTINEECIMIYRPDSVETTRYYLKKYRPTYNLLRPHQGSACKNKPPFVAFPESPKLRALPDTIDPDRWLRFFNGRYFRRKIQSNGSVKLDNHSYYVSKQLSGQQVVLQLDANAREFNIIHQNKYLKSQPIKGLYDEVMDFELYLDLICQEAQTEWRTTKRKVRQRRMEWIA